MQQKKAWKNGQYQIRRSEKYRVKKNCMLKMVIDNFFVLSLSYSLFKINSLHHKSFL